MYSHIFQIQMHQLQQLKNERMTKIDGKGAVETAARWYEMYRRPDVFRPLQILIMLFIFQQLSGAYVIVFYAVNIFIKIGGNFGQGINEYGALVMMGTIRFVMSIVTAM